jgi:hypothetical protein
MPAITLSNCHVDPLRIECGKCGRRGQYRLETLRQTYGATAALPDGLVRLADCPRRGNPSDPCAAG